MRLSTVRVPLSSPAEAASPLCSSLSARLRAALRLFHRHSVAVTEGAAARGSAAFAAECAATATDDAAEIVAAAPAPAAAPAAVRCGYLHAAPRAHPLGDKNKTHAPNGAAAAPPAATAAALAIAAAIFFAVDVVDVLVILGRQNAFPLSL